MQIENPQTKEAIQNRLRRIEGQLRGVHTMVADERDCREILQQLTAVRSALKATTQLFMKEYATDCMLNLDVKDNNQRVKLVEDMINFLGKAA